MGLVSSSLWVGKLGRRCYKDIDAACESANAGIRADANLDTEKLELRELTTSDARVVEDNFSPSTSLNTLLVRQLVDPNFAEMNRPCAKAIVAKYDHIDFNSMSLAGKTALLNAIIDC